MADYPRVTIVNIGTLSMNKFWDENERMREPSATCVLIETAGLRLIVDPSPHPDDLARLLFDRRGLRAGDVDQVFLTHRHGDHRFGLDLFDDKPWLVAAPELEAWRRSDTSDPSLADRFQAAEGRLPAGLSLLLTPGHTATHHSLVLSSPWGRLVVAGDAVMTQDYWDAEEGYHNSVDFPAAADSIRKLKSLAAVVIPGHGNVILNLSAGHST